MNDISELKAFISASELDEEVQKALIDLLSLEMRDAPLTEYAAIIRVLADKS